MSPLIEGAFKAIESDDPEEVGEGFLTLAEVVAVNRIQGFQSDIIPEANDEVLEWGPLEKIQKIVLRWIETHPDHPHVCSAFWALSKFCDKSLKPFFRQWLARYVELIEPYTAPIGQILVNLDRLDEKCISNNGFSAGELGKNLDDAIEYLRRTTPKRRKS
jgi:hypothetical protein